MPPTTTFSVSFDEGEALACGLGVVTKQYLGLFEIAIRPTYQRRGLAYDYRYRVAVTSSVTCRTLPA